MSTNFSTNVFGVQLPSALSNAPEEGGICNVPAILLIVMCALLLIRGVSESAKTNAIMVVIKLAVLVMFIVIGVQGFEFAEHATLRPATASLVSPPPRASSSSRSSGWTAWPPPVRKRRILTATYRWRS